MWKTGRYDIYAVAYGSFPYGPHGGTCGIINDGKFATYGFAGTGSIADYSRCECSFNSSNRSLYYCRTYEY